MARRSSNKKPLAHKMEASKFLDSTYQKRASEIVKKGITELRKIDQK